MEWLLSNYKWIGTWISRIYVCLLSAMDTSSSDQMTFHQRQPPNNVHVNSIARNQIVNPCSAAVPPCHWPLIYRWHGQSQFSGWTVNKCNIAMQPKCNFVDGHSPMKCNRWQRQYAITLWNSTHKIGLNDENQWNKSLGMKA